MEYEVVRNTRAKASIWKHFGLRKRKSDGTLVENIAVCNICNSAVKYSGGTSNLNSHIRVYHPAVMGMTGLASIPVPTAKDTNIQAQTNSKVLHGQTPSDSSHQTLLNILGTRYPPKSQKALAITTSIANFIIKDFRPYRIVDSPEFRKMFKTLDPRYQCPSRKQYSDVLIPEKYASVKMNVLDKLKNATQVAITTDGWTSRSTESYVTVTSTHINNQWELQNFVLQTPCMPESHTGENIADALTKALDEWNIPRSPLFMVSDNAANMIKAGELLECELHLGCYAHSLNLAVQKCLGVSSVSRILACVRKIVVFFHLSSVAAAMLKTQASLLELPYHKLVIDVCTRWNIAYDMLDRYLSIQVAVVSVLMSKDLKHKDKDLKFLSDEEITLAEEVMCCLKPLKAITTTMCSETSPTASIILPIHHQLLDHVLIPQEGDSTTIVNMKKSMSGNLRERYVGKEKVLNKITALDPRFKAMPYLTEEERLSVFTMLVREAGNCLLPETEVTVKTEPVEADNNLVTPQALPTLPTLSVEESSHPPKKMPTQPKVLKVESVSSPSSSTLGDILGDIYVTKVETLHKSRTSKRLRKKYHFTRTVRVSLLILTL